MIKPSILRICSAFLLMAIAVALSLGMIAAAVDEPQKEEEESFVWLRLPLKTKAMGEIRLYTAEGLPLSILTADESGKAVTGPLPAGTYYAVTEQCCCRFSLSEHAQVTVDGCGRFDGQMLHLEGTKAGKVQLSRQGSSEEWLEYTLSDGKITLRQVVRCTDGEPIACVFEGVPFGSYQLRENGSFCCNVTLSAEAPNVSIAIP